jgi:hypothetical protein
MAVLLVIVGCASPTPGQSIKEDAPDGAPVKAQPGAATPTQTPSATATPTQTPQTGTPTVPEAALALVDLALADLASQLKTSAENIDVLSVEAVDFSDASLGVPEPDKMYAQVVTPGYAIQLRAGGKEYTYHGSGDRIVLVP